MKQTTHVGVVREWLVSLGILTAISISREEARIKLAAFLPMLMTDFEDRAFTAASLNHVAKACVKGFPTYPELHNHLRDWWRTHNPIVALPAPPPPAPRPPPTEEEIAYVHGCVQQVIANMRGEPATAPATPRRVTPVPAEQLLAIYEAQGQGGTTRAAMLREEIEQRSAAP